MNGFCGYVAVIGRPNVGKSTLLNRLVGQKVSIISHRPQTTRQRILGIKTWQAYQVIYVDTPGLHLKGKKEINRRLNQEVKAALEDIEVVLWVVEALKLTPEDEAVLDLIQGLKVPIFLVVNKIDNLKEKKLLLPFLERLSEKSQFAGIFPVSAHQGDNLEVLEQAIFKCLPESPFYFAAEDATDRSKSFRIAELIREKIMVLLQEEVPYSVAVEVESMQVEGSLSRINAILWVERESQKPILIGKKGEQLRQIGMQARIDIERLLGMKVMLRLWVKVKENWSNNAKDLNALGL